MLYCYASFVVNVIVGQFAVYIRLFNTFKLNEFKFNEFSLIFIGLSVARRNASMNY